MLCSQPKLPRVYGRQQFEQERDFELRCEQRRMAGTQALLWQLNSLIDKLDAKEREIIIRRYVDGMRVEDVYKSLSISRATAFRRLEAGLLHMADLLIPSTKAQMSFYLIGEGGAGKSIMQHVLKVLFGRAWTPLQFSRLNGGDNGGRFLIPLLQGRLVAYDDDLPASQMGETEIFKKLITCESPMISERKGKDMEMFQPFVRVFASGNFSLSSVCDSSSAFWRRVLIFGVRPKDPRRKDDPFLGDKIMAEGEGILLWALDGLKRLLENKYKFSESEKSKRLKREAMRENNSVISFVETELIFDEKARTPRADMYKAYSSYCRDNAFDTVRKKDAFAYILSELIKHGGDQSRQNGIETYRGVRIARPITPTITLRGGNKA